MEQLLNFSVDLDVPLLDGVIERSQNPSDPHFQDAQRCLLEFKNHPDSWTRVATILEQSSSSNTRFFGLQILEDTVKYRWKGLPADEHEGIREYVYSSILGAARQPNGIHEQRVLVAKLDSILVQILKHEWIEGWGSFIPQIIADGNDNEDMCENTMNILLLLSEEIFEFSQGEMVLERTRILRNQYEREFSVVFEFCMNILHHGTHPSLIISTLKCLEHFVTWISWAFLFNSDLIDVLVNKMIPIDEYRIHALRCLAEIAGIGTDGQYNMKLKGLFLEVANMLPESIIDIVSHDADDLAHGLAMFFTSFLRHHWKVVVSDDCIPQFFAAHKVLVELTSLVDQPVVFKICLDYWHYLSSSIHNGSRQRDRRGSDRRLELLQDVILINLADLLISRVVRPEEVIICEDENGELIEEKMRDLESIQLYNSIKDILVYLTHILGNTDDMMIRKMEPYQGATRFVWHELNTLCWAVGSISGALNEMREKRFLVIVIKALLELCSRVSGKDNKAVVASNIMYVVGQYPRFLSAHWKFLKTVVRKLFEFMHEEFPGVKKMSCETFLRISQKCRKQFVKVQRDEDTPFVNEIIRDIEYNTGELEQSHLQMFYEATANMITAEQTAEGRAVLVLDLMHNPNARWFTIVGQVADNISALDDPVIMEEISNVLKLNNSVAKVVGSAFMKQIGQILEDMLNIYKYYSERISGMIGASGAVAARYANVRNMRSVKKQTLRLLDSFFQKASSPHVIRNDFLPPLLPLVLEDYSQNVPDARDAEVLSVMTTLLKSLRGYITPEVPHIIDSIFACTVEMIRYNFEDYPDIRISFFNFVHALIENCFECLRELPLEYHRKFVECIVWAFKHADRASSETGLKMLHLLFRNFESSTNDDERSVFYTSFYDEVLSEVLVVFTDGFHMSGFTDQCTILCHLVYLVVEDRIPVPLFSPEEMSHLTSNMDYVRERMTEMLSRAFPNVGIDNVSEFVVSLFRVYSEKKDAENLLRDFLVQKKEFLVSPDELFRVEREQREREQRMAVPGLVPASERNDEPTMFGDDDVV